jgi:hypothetical protein
MLSLYFKQIVATALLLHVLFLQGLYVKGQINSLITLEEIGKFNLTNKCMIFVLHTHSFLCHVLLHVAINTKRFGFNCTNSVQSFFFDRSMYEANISVIIKGASGGGVSNCLGTNSCTNWLY